MKTLALLLAVLVVAVADDRAFPNPFCDFYEFCGWSDYGFCNENSDCRTSGCSSQVCGAQSHNTTCEWLECYNDLAYGVTCACINGQCQWICIGDVDEDYDGAFDEDDNCPSSYNPDQTDSDSDGFGDVCDGCPNDADNDVDADGVCGDVDICPDNYDPNQTDADIDGIGDVCECFAANLNDANPVNLFDLAIVDLNWLQEGPSLSGDTNRDEIVDAIDLNQVAQLWLSDCTEP